MTQIAFFATRTDILGVLRPIERARPIKYVVTGNKLDRDFPEFLSAETIAGLGSAIGDSAVTCERYLICDASLSLAVRTIDGTGGMKRYCMDQLINGDTISFCAGGLHNSGALLCGSVGTASSTRASVELMAMVRREIDSQFVRLKGYRIGPIALQLLNHGKRFTPSIHSPPEYDVTL
ncbi:MAG: hypothetical protein KF805_16390 [Phycisphaeraceae bacterium]|nr:hypothetical protein [Phycisphaeraceae bacterium]